MSISITNGETFDRAGQFVVSEDGIAVSDMSGWTGRCQVRTQTGLLVEELTFEWLDAAQRLFRIRSADTSGWPVGTHLFDIQLTTPAGQVVKGPVDLLIASAGVTQ